MGKDNEGKYNIKGDIGEEIVTFTQPLSVLLEKEKNKVIKTILDSIELAWGKNDPHLPKVRSAILDNINGLYLIYCQILGEINSKEEI